MIALIFGNLGFVGSHLSRELSEMAICGFDLKSGQDMRDYEQVRVALDKCKPDYIFHLAALPYVAESNTDPQRAIDTHIKSTVNLLEAVKNLGMHPKIHIASTSEEYGYENQTDTVTEDSPIRSNTMYGITKNAMTNIAQFYTRNYGMHIVITRAFNHLGPGASSQFAAGAFAKQIVEIENGTRDILRHGNLETLRNYTDVRDIVRAYVDVINAEPGIYNVCSDNNVSMHDLLETLTSIAEVPIKTEQDKFLYKPGTSVFHPPSYEKLNKAVGWHPSINLEQSLQDMLNDWRRRLK